MAGVCGVGAGSVLATRQVDEGQARAAQAAAQMKTLDNVRLELASTQAAAYRTVARISSLDEKTVQAARARMKQRLGELDARLGQVAAGAEGDEAALEAATAGRASIASYLASTDSATDLAWVDPNTGE